MFVNMYKRLFDHNIGAPDEYKGMKIGDLIVTYFKGFYVLEYIQRRFKHLSIAYDWTKNPMDPYSGDEINPCLSFRQYADGKGKIIKNPKIKECDGKFCFLASDFIHQELQNIEETKKKISKLLLFENTHKTSV